MIKNTPDTKGSVGNALSKHRLVGLAFGTLYMAQGLMFPFFNLYLNKTLGWSGTNIGLMTSLGSLLILLSQPVWGRVSDLANKSHILAAALGIAALLTLVQPLAAGSFLLFSIIRLAHAVFAGSLNPMLDGITLDVLGDAKDTYGSYRLWGSFGFALTSLIFGKVYELIGFGSMFVSYFIITMASMFIVLGIHPDRDGKTEADKPSTVPLRAVLANPPLVMLLIGLFLVMMPFAAADNFLTLYFDALGVPASYTGYAFGLTAVVEVPLFLAAPKLINRFGHKPVLVASTGLFGLKLLLNVLYPSPGIAIILQTLTGIGFAFFQVASVLMVDALVPKQFRTTGQAILATVTWSLSGIVGGVIVGRLLDAAGIFTAFRIAGYVALLGTCFIWLAVPASPETTRDCSHSS